MPLRNAHPVTFRPLGVTDTLDGTNAAAGSMENLQNFVPSQTTAGSWVNRPAAVALVPVGGWYSVTTPTLVMPLVYTNGFVIGFVSDTTTGKDVPFVGLATSPTIFLSGTITGLGVANANCPASVSANQAVEWEPPTATILVDSVVFSHPNMPNKAGRLTGVTTGTFAWETYDTAPQALPSRAHAVSQMNGRVYYACGTSLVLSDSLLPKVVTNASQALNFANGVSIIALGQLALDNPIVGGVVQSLLAFQGTTAIQQITGDPATSNLATNVIKAGTGTAAPASVVPTSKGVAFVSPEGVRFVNLSGQVTDPVGDQGTGVAFPFIQAAVPSRICAASNANMLRVSVGVPVSGGLNADYWLDMARSSWSGPHTCDPALICPGASQFPVVPGTFYFGRRAADGILYRGDPTPVFGRSTYIEFGSALTFIWSTSATPDNEQNAANTVQVTTLTCSIPVGVRFSIAITSVDETGNIDSVSAFLPRAVSANARYKEIQVAWPSPAVGNQFKFNIQGTAHADVQIGNLYAVFQPLGYPIMQTI